MEKILLLSMILSVLVSCGGGGGNPKKVVISEQKKAKLASTNNQVFIKSALFDSSRFIVDSEDYSIALDVLKEGGGTRTVSGDISGTLKITGEKISNTLVRFTYVFNNFSDKANNGSMNGSLVENIKLTKTYGTGANPLSALFIFNNLQISKKGEAFSYNGEMTQTGLYLQTLNLSFKNLKTGKTGKYRKYKISSNPLKQAISYKGEIYSPEYGYVTIRTKEKLSYAKDGAVQVGGIVSLTGDSSEVLIKQAYDQRLRIETDTNGDSNVDDVKILSAINFVEMKNTPPVVSINLPSKIYTNTPLSVDNVVIYDPDLDDISVTVAWSVNNHIKSTKKQFDIGLFKKHDDINLMVTAKDDSQHVVQLEKSQKVLNSKPVVKINNINTEVELAQKLLLDASQSYDADGDDIVFNWSIAISDYDDEDLKGKYLESTSTKEKKFFSAEKIYHKAAIANYKITVTLDDKDDGAIEKIFPTIHVIPQDIFNRKVITFGSSTLSAIEFADVNNDGFTDIVATTEANELKVYLQDATGHFNVAQTISLESHSPYDYSEMKLADVNNDGLIDIVVTVPSGSNDLIVLYQDQNYSFRQGKSYKTRKYIYNGETHQNRVSKLQGPVDLNKDGLQDIVTLGGGGVDFFVQQSDKSLQDDKQIFLTSLVTYNYMTRFNLLDVDNNGLTDLIIGNNVLYQDTQNNFSEVNHNKSLNMDTNALENTSFVDIGSDGFAELLLITSEVMGAFSYPKLYIYTTTATNRKKYSFSTKLDIPLTMNAFEVLALDVTNDGMKDIIVPAGGGGQTSLVVYVNKGDGTYMEGQYFKGDNKIFVGYDGETRVVDMNNDGKLDIVKTGSNGIEIYHVK